MYQSWEENREYIRLHIVPKLQEIQRDMYGSSIFTVQLSTSLNGGISVAVVAREIPDSRKITATAYFDFFYTRNAKYNNKVLGGISGFIKKHTA